MLDKRIAPVAGRALLDRALSTKPLTVEALHACCAVFEQRIRSSDLPVTTQDVLLMNFVENIFPHIRLKSDIIESDDQERKDGTPDYPVLDTTDTKTMPQAMSTLVEVLNQLQQSVYSLAEPNGELEDKHYSCAAPRINDIIVEACNASAKAANDVLQAPEKVIVRKR